MQNWALLHRLFSPSRDGDAATRAATAPALTACVSIETYGPEESDWLDITDEAPLGDAEALTAHSEAPKIVQEATVRILRERIGLLGAGHSGAYQHYSLLLERGFPIPVYERAILDFVHRRLPNLDSYHEIGSGLGTLPLMLAHDRFPTVGIERDEPRHLTAMAVLRDLVGRKPEIEPYCRFIGSAFPDAVSDIDVSGSLAIVTDFVSTHTKQELAKLCEGLSRYRYVLMDLQRFCQKREKKEDQEALITELAGYGLTVRPGKIDCGAEGHYRLFAGRLRQGERGVTAAQRGAFVPEPKVGEQPIEIRGLELPGAPPAAEPLTTKPAQLPSPTLPPRPRRAHRNRFGGALGLSALLMIGLPTALSVAYYGFIASDQYVSTFEFAVRTPGAPDQTQAKTSSYFGSGMMSPDSFVVSDFIDSSQAVRDVGHDLDLRSMFSSPLADFWTRFDPTADQEHLDYYWTKMVHASFDLISGNVSVTVRAFSPEDSLKLSDALIKACDVMFNQLNESAQQDLVKVADRNLQNAEQQMTAARTELTELRHKLGVLDPGAVAQSSSTIIDTLRTQLGGLTSAYESTRTSSPRSPLLPVLKSQIEALKTQIAGADRYEPSMIARVTTPDEYARYQALDTRRQFAESVYADALKLRQQAYLAAHQQVAFLAMFVRPQLPTTSLYPDRPRGIATVFAAAAAAWLISVLVAYAVRDHLDV
jgi:capsular polysaccharide transport system permease protein